MQELLISIVFILWSFSTIGIELSQQQLNTKDSSSKSELYYNKCISSLYNHPYFLSASGGIQMGDQQQLMRDLDSYCICHSREDVKQKQMFETNNVGYFFHNKKEYLANLDVCIQDNVSAQNRSSFFKVISLIKLSPIVGQDVAMRLPSSIAGPSISAKSSYGVNRSCLEHKVISACRENSSLYFLFRCFKRKIKDRKFFDSSYSTCSRSLITATDIEP